MVSLGGLPGAFPAPFAHGLCSVKHSERVACHGIEKMRRTKACTALAGSRGKRDVPVAWQVSGNGKDGAGMSPGEV